MLLRRIFALALMTLLLAGCQTWSERLPPTASLPDSSTQGQVEVRYFDGIGGSDADAMTSMVTYPDNPDEIVEISQLDAPRNRANNYGSLIRGYIVPPEDGRYQFFISADDTAELLLSPSNDPSDARVIASVPRFTDYQDFDAYSAQSSAGQDLSEGQKYYFEIRHKEGYGGDHVSVAWDGPAFSRSVIDGQYLYSYARGTEAPEQTESQEEAYGRGYRVGYFDGERDLSFRPEYPMMDADSDGLYDNWEVYHGLDPSDPNDAGSDRDDDFLSAVDEFWVGTNPENPDTDGDGIPDGVEFAYGLDPLDESDATEDMDGDGYSNLEEYQADSELDAPESVPERQVELVPGIMGQYFSARSFENFASSRVDESLSFDWGSGAPLEGMPGNNFSVRWVGYITPPEGEDEGTYELRVTRDDGVRIWIDDQLVLDAWSGQVSTEYSSTFSLTADEMVPVRIEYYEGYGSARMDLQIENQASGETVAHNDIFMIPAPSGEGAEDTDGDGIPDLYEMTYGLNPWEPNASEVVNSEGVSNLEAYETGVNPWTLEETERWEVIEESADSGLAGSPVEESTESEAGGSFELVWTAPSTRVDGSSIALSEIDYYLIEYGESPDNLDQSVRVDSGDTRYQFKGLEPGTWYISVKVVDTEGRESEPSEVLEYDAQ